MENWQRSGLKIRGRSVASLKTPETTDGQTDSDEEELDIHATRCEANRRKIGIRWQSEKRRIAMNNDGTRESAFVNFVISNFSMKKCTRYTVKNNKDGKCFCDDTKENHENEIDKPITWTCPLTPLSARSTVSKRSMSPKSRNSVAPLIVDNNELSHNAVINMKTLAVPNQKGSKLPPLILGSLISPTSEINSKDSAKLVANMQVSDTVRAGPLFVQPDTNKTVESIGATATNGISPNKWVDKNAICEYMSTNAFGTVEFANDEARSKPAKVHILMYVRIADTTSEDKVIELMTKYWKMLQPHRPSLVISVVGGAKNFKLDGKKREIFNRGLVKAAQATHAWIVTSGSCMGVMKAVGEAVKEGQSLELTSDRVTRSLRCIGIGHWGYVKKREDLITPVEHTTPGCWPATYVVDPIIRHGQPAPLDPNHTHFILVDDGYRNVFRPKTVAEFRAKLERKIAQDFDKGGLKIPVVVLLVEGGIESFDFVKESVNFGIPVVLCQGTGRAADILSYAFNHHTTEKTNGVTERKISPRYKEKVIEKIYSAFADTVKTSKSLLDEQLKEYFAKIADLVSECCQIENMIVVFDINHHQDLDLAILSALLKGHARRYDQLILALKWNRSDVAAEHIFTPDAVWTDQELNSTMVEALRERKVEFVKLLLQHGVIMKDFLTTDILTDLYNLIKETDQLKIILNLPRFGVPLEIIYQKIEIMLKRKFIIHLEAHTKIHRSLEEGDKPPTEKVTLLKPFRELFLWALLINRQEMTTFFWQRNENPLIAALAASKICKMMARRALENDLDSAKSYLENKKEFEALAVSIINYAFEVDNEKALLLVEQPHPSWGDANCLTMASMATDKVVLGILCPFYMLFKPHFFDTASLGWNDHKQVFEKHSVSPHFGFKCRIKAFYSAPITKFWTWSIFYCLFLLLYSYVLLFDLRYHMTWPEIMLHVWVASMVVNKFWMMMSGTIAGMDTNSLIYTLIKNFWARVELYSELLHFFGLALRWLPYKYFDFTKVVLCIAAVFFYLRIFRAYMASSYLGPQLFVIRKMFRHVLMFLSIVLVVMLAYGVSFQTMMYAQRSFYSGIFADLFYYPYWEMHGDIELGTTVEGKVDGCFGNDTMNDNGDWCPRKFWAGTLMMAAYTLISNTLLINLLIAVFSHVFDEVHTNSKQIWKYEMWLLATEFDNKPIFPPPIAIVEIFFRFTNWIIFQRMGKSTDPYLALRRRQREHLQIFEKECLNEYLHSIKEAKMKDLNTRAQNIQEKLDGLAKAFDEDRNRHYDHQIIDKQNNTASIEQQAALLLQERKRKKREEANKPSAKEQLKLMQNRMHSLEQEIGGMSEMLKQVLKPSNSQSSLENPHRSVSSSEDEEKSLHSD